MLAGFSSMATVPLSFAEGDARILDGRALAAGITARVAEAARTLGARTGTRPGLAVVLVGNDPASRLYVAGKGRKAKETGFHSVQHHLSETTSEDDLLSLIARLNADPAIHGILVQFPLPPHIDRRRVVEAINPGKDVDGLHPLNVGRLAASSGDAMVPCTPAGALFLIRHARGEKLTGLNAVIVGRSNLVGKPMAQLLLREDCTVTVAHSKTSDLGAFVAGADIIVAAVGRPMTVRGEWIKRGATVIDVGQNRIDLAAGRTKLVGDVDYDKAAKIAGAITPVPGGAGPMTIAMLMANTLKAAHWAAGLEAPAWIPG
jgi:methylenetetrahydrofolate dehydrogenase (NADP+) / methenyltetrahydrofolate cyclohydrolase